MNEKELSFEEDIVRTSLALRIMKKDQGEPEAPERGAEPLPVDIALKEAEELFQKVYDVRLNAPDGSLGWLSVGDDGKGVDLADEGAGTGITGIGLFAAALLSVSSDTSIIRKAGICLDRVHDELGSRFDELKGKPQTEASRIISSKLGEASGFGGILRALVFMNRYSENDAFAPLIHDILKFLSERLDCKQVTMTDRLGGLSGLIATLCDCPEYSGDPLALDIIGECSERLMELKSFDADGKALWETISKRHQISGAGHGMIGIAYALYKAGKLLDENKWAAAVREAVDFELETYSEKLGTWPDRRNWPPEGYMHGYCSGAPGIGILCKGIDTEGTDRIAEYAERAVNSKPLLFRDHFCCGNSSVVEYYLTMGRRDDAGRVLAGMYKRKKQTGAYRLMSTGYNDIPLPTFLSGFSGIGYEMLRYAYTDRIYSVLG